MYDGHWNSWQSNVDCELLRADFCPSSLKYLRSQVSLEYLLFGQSCRLPSVLLASADQVAPRDGTLTWSTKDNLLV